MIDSPARDLEILHVTDCHLYRDPDVTLLGMNTRDSLRAVLSAAATGRPPHLILATGDLAQDGDAASYRLLAECFREAFPARPNAPAPPVHWLPGNHDLPAVMRETLTDAPMRSADEIIQGEWQIILLDSTIPNEVGGRLAPAELRRLDRLLARHPQRHALISLHHNPISVGSAWMEPIGLENSDAFFEIVDRHPQVRVILWGHVHQAVDTQRNGVRLLASPSTCIQFKPHSAEFALDDAPPACRRLRLGADGAVRTEICHAQNFIWKVDYAATGY
jgi:Icc protein